MNQGAADNSNSWINAVKNPLEVSMRFEGVLNFVKRAYLKLFQPCPIGKNL